MGGKGREIVVAVGNLDALGCFDTDLGVRVGGILVGSGVTGFIAGYLSDNIFFGKSKKTIDIVISGRYSIAMMTNEKENEWGKRLVAISTAWLRKKGEAVAFQSMAVADSAICDALVAMNADMVYERSTVTQWRNGHATPGFRVAGVLRAIELSLGINQPDGHIRPVEDSIGKPDSPAEAE